VIFFAGVIYFKKKEFYKVELEIVFCKIEQEKLVLEKSHYNSCYSE